MRRRSGQSKSRDATPRRWWPRGALRRVRGSLTRVGDTLALWHFRATSRRELEQMEERLLKDAGLDRAEAYKPFWRE